MTVVFSQAAPFTGAAYEYLRAEDALPTYGEIADEPDPLCRVKLFQPFSHWTFYACAATEYEGIEGPVLTGYCVSPLGPDCDEFGDQGLAEIAGCGCAAYRPSATSTSSRCGCRRWRPTLPGTASAHEGAANRFGV
jgi:hypothetical protein